MIKMENVRKIFDNGKVVALDNVDFEVEPGEVICVIGPSGSGKSTLIRCMSGLEVPDEGEVYIDGVQMDFQRPKNNQKLVAKLGFVFQHFNLFPHKTVLENLTLGPIIADKKIRQMLNRPPLRSLNELEWKIRKMSIRRSSQADRSRELQSHVHLPDSRK